MFGAIYFGQTYFGGEGNATPTPPPPDDSALTAAFDANAPSDVSFDDSGGA